ncbi:MAG: hypothetical protein VXZ53_26050 [Planctomycetota bacterium]|nr:hypothetical protein [Planctomycetota bacterium]
MVGIRDVTGPNLRRLFGSLVFILVIGTQITSAKELKVRFDAPSIIPFDTGTTKSTLEKAVVSQRDQIELEVEISTWLLSGKPERIQEILFEIFDLSGSSRVIDFLPRDEISSDFIGGIKVEKSKEKNRSIGLSASSNLPWMPGGNGQLASGNKNVDRTSYEKKSPQRHIIVSGTSRQGRGVVYRFRRANEHSLEGTRRLTLRLSVPQGWSTSLLRVHCVARGLTQGAVPGLRQTSTIGQQTFIIPVFDRGDSRGQQDSERFFIQYQHLKRLAEAHARELRREENQYPLKQIAAILSLEDSNLPEAWPTQVLESGDVATFTAAKRFLPDDLQQAGTHYLAARRAILSDHKTLTAKEEATRPQDKHASPITPIESEVSEKESLSP